MSPFLLATALALGAAGGAPGARPAGEPVLLRFAPAPDAALSKRLRIDHGLFIDRMGMSRDGGPFQADAVDGSLNTTLTVAATDRYSESGGAPGSAQRVARFERTYDELGVGGRLSMGAPGGPQQAASESSLDSPLRGKSVDFVWVPEEQGWSRCYSREQLEEEWLAGLDGDMDLIALLPPGEVSEGDTWEIPLQSVRGLLAPGGDHVFLPRAKGLLARTLQMGVGGDLSGVLDAELSGQLSARLTAVRQEGGARVALVHLTLKDLRSTHDCTEVYRSAMADDERRERSRLEGVLLDYHLDAEGDLVWDLDAGRARSLRLTGNERFTSGIAKQMPAESGLSRIDAQASFSGTLNLAFTVEDRSGKR